MAMDSPVNHVFCVVSRSRLDEHVVFNHTLATGDLKTDLVDGPVVLTRYACKAVRAGCRYVIPAQTCCAVVDAGLLGAALYRQSRLEQTISLLRKHEPKADNILPLGHTGGGYQTVHFMFRWASHLHFNCLLPVLAPPAIYVVRVAGGDPDFRVCSFH